MNYRLCRTFLGVIFAILVQLLFLSRGFTWAQSDFESKLKSADFLELADLRANLVRELQEIENEIEKLEKKIPIAQEAESTITETTEELDKLLKKAQLTPNEELLKEAYEARLKAAKELLGGRTADSFIKELAQRKLELESSKSRMNQVQKKIASFFTPEQKFKSTMSIIFAILIGLVIIGFFVLSWVDVRVRIAIFGGQSGIQFLTLFSLVIAIILFGITNILSDKELAALLGGLSGYILGRQTDKTTEKGGASQAPPASQPSKASQGTTTS